jgi:DNA-binding NtrC family response regulator
MENPAPVNQIRGTILLVDDEKMVLDVGVKMFTRLGFNVIPVENGRKAIETFKERKDSIDIVVLDIVMPDLGGAEVVDAIKDIDPNTKIMLSSGYGRDRNTADIMQNCHAFIQKPFSMQELSASLQSIME